MTRKCLLLFTIFFICTFFLLSGILGEKGFVYRKQLSRQLESQNDILEKLNLAKSNLELQEQNIFSEDFLKDKAIKQGYSFENDVVYYFDSKYLDYDTEKMYDLKKLQADNQEIWFLSRSAIALISSAAAGIAVLLMIFARTIKKHGAKDGTEQE
ncbi:MAG: hypothetical protein ACQGQO_00895 [Sphaerochaetaceae bacterium]